MIDGQNYSWTQPVCWLDYDYNHPGQTPVRMSEAMRTDEVCCLCGKVTNEGIYMRTDPSTVPYPTPEED